MTIINTFLSSWELFHNTYISGFMIAIALSLIGIFIIIKDQIFLGATLSQTSALGIAIGFFIAGLFHLSDDSTLRYFLIYFLSAGFSVFSAVLISKIGNEENGKLSYESATGLVFLFASSLSILIVAKAPFGLKEIRQILSSSIIGSGLRESVLFTALAIFTVLFIFVFKEKLLLVSLDPVFARVSGIRFGFYEILLSSWIGLSIGISLQYAGMIYTFGFLVLPALIGKNLSKNIKKIFYIAPATAILAAFSGFLVSASFDFPISQIAVFSLALFAFGSYLYGLLA